jgi:hypothetical protein
MQTLQTIYNILQVNRKIENFHIRIMYLKDVWGMEQSLIAECEGISQSYVSKELMRGYEIVPRETFLAETNDIWTVQEIEFLHRLPREVIKDIPVLAFIEDILKVHPNHPFFVHVDTPTNLRIAALISLGIQNKRLMVLFDKSQPSISMYGKRYTQRILEMERTNRYDQIGKYTLSQVAYPKKFTKAGGIN